MRSNGLHHTAVSPLQRHSRLVFNRMSRQIGKLIESGSTDNVHRFRTNSRRVEAFVSELVPESGNKRKLLKLLSRLRKKAGKVRDLHVQITFLKALKVPDRQNHRAQLIEWLETEESRRRKKLKKAFDEGTADELGNRLRRAQGDMQLDGIDPLELARKRLPNPGTGTLTEKVLHACRIEAKRARYLAELAAESPDSQQFIEELKRAQDAIGEWHDIMKLKERAEQLFGGASDSALVSVLQNVSRAKFRRATSALVTAIAAVSVAAPKKAAQSATVSISRVQDLEQSAVA